MGDSINEDRALAVKNLSEFVEDLPGYDRSKFHHLFSPRQALAGFPHSAAGCLAACEEIAEEHGVDLHFVVEQPDGQAYFYVTKHLEAQVITTNGPSH